MALIKQHSASKVGYSPFPEDDGNIFTNNTYGVPITPQALFWEVEMSQSVLAWAVVTKHY